jgi:zinc transport system permease protein
VLGLALIAALYHALVAAALDEEAARVSGVPVGFLNVALAALVGITVAVSMRIVGILLIAALMVIPVIAAQRVAWSLRSTMGLAVVLGVGSVLAGLTASYYADLPPGGAIVLTAAGLFIVAAGVESVLRRV